MTKETQQSETEAETKEDIRENGVGEDVEEELVAFELVRPTPRPGDGGSPEKESTGERLGGRSGKDPPSEALGPVPGREPGPAMGPWDRGPDGGPDWQGSGNGLPANNGRDVKERRFTLFGRPRKPERTAIVLRSDRNVDVYKPEGALIEGRTGHYRVEPEGMFWVDEDIPRGWITVYPEGDSEPVMDRDPVGYGPKDLAILMGPWIVHAIGGGFKGVSKKFEMGGWKSIVGYTLLGMGLMWLIMAYGGA